MNIRIYAIAAALTLALGGIFVQIAAPSPQTETGRSGYIEITPDKLHWFAVPAIPKAQFAYLSGDPSKKGLYAFRVKLEPRAFLPPHYHSMDESGTVLSGTFYTGMGNKCDKKKGHALPPGSYAFIPAGMRHYAWVEEPTIVQVQGSGPWQLIPVDESGKPSGDPVSLPAYPIPPSRH